jgi:hypothetical protein
LQIVNQGFDSHISDDEDCLLDEFSGLQIATTPVLSESTWLSTSPMRENSSSQPSRTWVLDDFGSFIWTKCESETNKNSGCIGDADIAYTAPNHQQASTPSPSPFDLNDWLIVAETDSSADDGSSIVVLSMND